MHLGITGEPELFAGDTDTMPTADIRRGKLSVPALLGGIGYRWGLEEDKQLSRGMQPLDIISSRARAARERALHFIQNIFFDGAVKNARPEWDSLFGADATFPAGHVLEAAPGNDSTLWSTKTGRQIRDDIQLGIDKIVDTTNGMYLPDTIALPPKQMMRIRTEQWNTGGTDRTILEHIQANSPTGRPFSFLTTYRLRGKGAGGTDRMLIYRRANTVLRAHLPMNHRFVGPVFRESWSHSLVPGIFRIAGTEWRIPAAAVYVDRI